MKKIITLAILLVVCFVGFAQSQEKAGIISKNQKGIITSVEFSSTLEKNKIPMSANAFFEAYLDIGPNDMFEKAEHKSKRKEFIHDHFDQYYKGVKVDGAGYNLHYKNGQMYFANGNFVKVGNINPIPSISLDNAIASFLQYKSITKETVVNTITELLIKEITDVNSENGLGDAALVYRIYLESDHENNDEVGYVNAHTGKVVMTEPRLTHTTGTFDTRYNGTRQAETDPVTGGHRLLDDTRNATIHTRNLQNNSTVFTNAVELIDNDNNWTTAEHGANNNDMGLDVHWGLQEIYNWLDNTHGINSFDDNGVTINAYVRYGNNADNAFWDTTANVLAFGQGASIFNPLASLDVVAHEFGHGITDFQIGWALTGDERAFHEGLSDIWGAVLEQRILPNSVWQIGEQITLTHSHLRNIQNTNDVNARDKIADTYLSTQYNGTATGYEYVRSGVFSHWFYILVNGESGTNDIGSSYAVNGIGLDLAEELIVEAVFNNYLDGTTTYPEIRTAIINAAEAIFCENSTEVKAVTDAWHAVGVGAKSPKNSAVITGSDYVCGSSNYSISNSGATFYNWSILYGSNIASITSNSTNVTLTQNGTNSGPVTIQATFGNATCGSTTLTKSIWVGKQPVDYIEFSNGIGEEGYFCTSHTDNDFQLYPNINGNTYQYRILDFPSLNVIYTSSILGGSGGTVYILPSPGWYIFEARMTNSCGTSDWFGGEVEFVDCSTGGGGGEGEARYAVYPNPASSEVNISFKKNTHDEVLIQTENITYLKLYDFVGNVLMEKKDGNLKSLNVSNMNEGMYYLEIISGDSKEIHRIIIEK